MREENVRPEHVKIGISFVVICTINNNDVTGRQYDCIEPARQK